MLAFFFVFSVLLRAEIATAVINVVLHRHSIGGASWFLKDFQDLTRLRIKAQLMVQGVVRTGVVVAGEGPTLFLAPAVSQSVHGCRPPFHSSFPRFS